MIKGLIALVGGILIIIFRAHFRYYGAGVHFRHEKGPHATPTQQVLFAIFGGAFAVVGLYLIGAELLR